MEERPDGNVHADAYATGGEASATARASMDDQHPEQDGQSIYAIGKIEVNFPSPGIEKELQQAVSQTDTAGQTDREAMREALSLRHNRYLVRHLCFTFNIEGLPTYIAIPRDPVDVDLLVETLRPRPQANDVDVVIGSKGPVAPAEACNGLMLPVLLFDQLYSFDTHSLIQNIPRPDTVGAEQDEQFRASAEELFGRVMQTADNAGELDKHRALNYLVVRYPAIYATTADAHSRNFALSAVEAKRSRLSGARNIVDVIFSYTNRQTDVTEQYFVRVDATEKFPFLVSKLAPYYERP